MQKKQSAVELLEQQLKERYSLMNSEPLFEQAKQMEKEQEAEIFKEAQICAVKHDGVYFKYESIEDYYNETYGGNNE
jgi:hypothetical protein